MERPFVDLLEGEEGSEGQIRDWVLGLEAAVREWKRAYDAERLHPLGEVALTDLEEVEAILGIIAEKIGR